MRRPSVLLCAMLGLALTSCSTPPGMPTAWRPSPIAVNGGKAVTELDYRFQTGDGLTLVAKLTMPDAGKAPPPVVIFIGGSGTWDSDYSQQIDATRSAFVLPVPDLAKRTAQAGIAFVRYQKRGVADPGALINEQWKSVRVTTLMDDLRHLLTKIKSDPRLDGRRIALVGHSEGTMIATWVGGSEPSVRAYVLLGLVRRNLRDVYRFQLVRRNGERYFKYADDKPADGQLDEAEIASATKAGLNFKGWKSYDWNKDGRMSQPEYLGFLDQSYRNWVAGIERLKPDELVPGDGSPAGWFQQHFRHRTVGEAWRTIKAPVLVVQGKSDTNTPFTTEVEPFRAMLSAQRHPDHRMVGLEGLDHWYKDANGTSQAEKAFDMVVPWLKERL